MTTSQLSRAKYFDYKHNSDNTYADLSVILLCLGRSISRDLMLTSS